MARLPQRGGAASGRPDRGPVFPASRAPVLHHRSFPHGSRRDDSALVIGGMILLLGLCGWAVGAEPGLFWALRGLMDDSRGPPRPPPITPDAMLRQFGARPLHPSAWPALFQELHILCRRAGLPRCPDLYYLPDPSSMNAYALGTADHAAITLTEGLLRGMSLAEISGILAHEIGHIRNNDGWAMTLAAALARATTLTACLGRSLPQPSTALALLLHSAPLLGEILHKTLSRLREFAADAQAAHLLDDPAALIIALQRLERHHSRGHAALSAPAADALSRFLRSHPDTWERVGSLRRLAGH